MKRSSTQTGRWSGPGTPRRTAVARAVAAALLTGAVAGGLGACTPGAGEPSGAMTTGPADPGKPSGSTTAGTADGTGTAAGTDTGASGGPGATPTAGPTTDGRTTGGPTATPTTPPSTPPTSTPATAWLVRVTRTGGLAGVNQSVLVKDDGTVTRLRRGEPAGTGHMSPAELARLKAALEAADFPHLPRVGRPGGIADGFTYQFVYGGYEVMAADPLPPALSRVITALPPFS
ncbi:hypothetical protein [Streptomyces sp. NRRL S-87]|uniref:hypothetical protein n=1 Tax=Streptomyces sp. NRRL S-87 TaxID=1463920 RepID=UPI00131D7EE7|nr:hypothetical protein [Streptomyces sp. NRRL S-87]